MAKGVLPTVQEGRILADIIREHKNQGGDSVFQDGPTHKTPRTYLARLKGHVRGAVYYGDNAKVFPAEVRIARKSDYEGVDGSYAVDHVTDESNTQYVTTAYNLCTHSIPFNYNHSPYMEDCGELLVFVVEDMYGTFWIVKECETCEGAFDSSSEECNIVEKVTVGKGNLRRDGNYIKEDLVEIRILNGRLCTKDVGTQKVYACCPNSSSSSSSS